MGTMDVEGGLRIEVGVPRCPGFGVPPRDRGVIGGFRFGADRAHWGWVWPGSRSFISPKPRSISFPGPGGHCPGGHRPWCRWRFV